MQLIPGSRTWLAAGMVLTLLGVACSERAPSTEEKTAARAWPMLGGSPQRNLANTIDTGIPETWSIKKGKEKNIKWTAKLGTKALGGPVVAGGRIFVGTNNDKPRDPNIKGDKGVVMCFRESDGQFLWQAIHDKLADEGLDVKGYGIASAPCVDGDRVYYVSNRCEVICADVAGDPSTGKAKILWTLDMIKELKVYPGGLAGSLSNCSPLIVDDLVFAATSNGRNAEDKVPAPDAPSFVAINKTTGKVVWQDHSPGDKIMDGQWSSPAAGQVNGQWQVIFPGGDGWLYSFEAKTGKLIWKFDCNPKGADFKAGGRGTAGFVVGTPVIWDNKLYVATGRQPDDGNGVGHLWCIDITKEPKNKDKDISPATKDSGLVWHFGGPVVPKPEDGSREFHFGRSISTVAIHDGLVYAAELAGFLNCLDARTGKKLWEFDLKASTWSSPYYVDGKVYMGTDDGTLYVFRHGKERKKPTKIDMSEALLSPPMAVNGVLYIGNGYNLFAIAAK